MTRHQSSKFEPRTSNLEVGGRAVRTQRASEVDSRPAGRRRLHVSISQETPLLAQKAASRRFQRTCLRIFTENHTPHLTDREPSRSLPRPCASSTSATCGASPFRESPRIDDESDSHVRTSEAARLHPARAASENLNGRRAVVNQFVMRARKKFADRMFVAMVRSPRTASAKGEVRSEFEVARRPWRSLQRRERRCIARAGCCLSARWSRCPSAGRRYRRTWRMAATCWCSWPWCTGCGASASGGTAGESLASTRLGSSK